MSRKPSSWANRAGDTRVLNASVMFTHQPFKKPLILSTGAIESITQADATVRVSVDGQEAVGRGCTYLSDLWAWPDPAISHEQRDKSMRSYCRELADSLPAFSTSPSHPLALGLRLHDFAANRDTDQTIHMPVLARAVCLSIFDAAIHDATGQALQISAFNLYDDNHPIPEADSYFGGVGHCFAAIRRMLAYPPCTTSPAWWVVGKTDDLKHDVKPIIEKFGYYAFKLKIMGQDALADANRVVEVYRTARGWGIELPRLTIDSNEANPDADSVLDFLDILALQDPLAYDALELIEQPTGRDIERHAFDWTAVATRKPIMVDEGLTRLDVMSVARDQGWSGFVLKTCKGHSFALAAAAWAHQHGMLLSLQDLTNPGLSAVHSALFANRVHTMNGVELNSPQFTPAANADWIDRHPGLFCLHNGTHHLPDAARTPGLGGAFN